MNPDPALDRFSGVLPLFPLPEVVLFPGTRIPLHIFEPRYRAMVRDVQRGEGFIGMVLARRSPQGGASDICKVACMGRMRRVHELPDGRFLMDLLGLVRVRIEHELTTPTAYRQARVSLLADDLEMESPADLRAFADEVLEVFNSMLRRLTDLPGPLIPSRSRPLKAGLVLDLLASYLPAEAAFKQCLLEEPKVRLRGELMLQLLGQLRQSLPQDTVKRLSLFPKPSPN